MNITLKTGTLDNTSNLNAWVITSEHAIVEGAEDLDLQRGDIININGDVTRNGVDLGNIA